MAPSRLPDLHVLILGAGLGGLTLAQALRKQGVSFDIFERDEGLHSRFPGWAIALHEILPDLTGAICDDLPPIETTSHLLPLDRPAQFCVYDGDSKFTAESDNAHLIRANRARLREWLATNIDVHWGKKMTKIEESESGVTLYFDDGTSATGDILVGADGVHSPVRTHLFGRKNLLKTLPFGQIVGEPTLNKEQYEAQMQLGRSAYINLGDTHWMFVGLNSVSEDASTAKYYWFFSWADPEAAHEPHWTALKSKQELLDYAKENCHRIDPKLTEIIRLTKVEEMRTPPLVLRDMVLEEMPNGRITLLGDAAHPMAPFRGEGGNQALRDSLNLAKALTKSDPANVQTYVKDYQEEMLVRGAVAVRRSRVAMQDQGKGTKEALSGWREEKIREPNGSAH